MNAGPVETPRFGGYLIVYNYGIAPTITTNLGVNTPIAGAGYNVNQAFGFGQAFSIYTFTFLGAPGPNNITIGGAYTLLLFDTFFAHGVTTSEGTAQGMGGVPALGAYAPPSGHPWIHHCIVVDNAMGPILYNAPFAQNGPVVADTIAGTLFQIDCGCYPASVGGVFPASKAAAGIGPWGAIQVGWAP